MFQLYYTNKFLKDIKRIKKRSQMDFDLVGRFIKTELSQKGALGLDEKYKVHKLSGNYKNNWECHIKPDLLIIWIEIKPDNNIELIRIGSHSDLF